MEAIDVMETYEEPLTLSLERTSCHCLSSIRYPTGKSEAIRLSQLNQLFSEPNTHRVCIGTKDIEYNVEDWKTIDKNS